MKSKASKNCRKKTRFRSEHHARICGSNHDGPLWPYVCGVCGHWHLTSKPCDATPITRNSSGIFGASA